MNSIQHTETKPYTDSADKKEQVRRMFDGIAPRYDLLNRLLSCGVDNWWRNRLLDRLFGYLQHELNYPNQQEKIELLDLATGTADLPLMICRRAKRHIQKLNITGADLSEGMLSVALERIKRVCSKRELKRYDAASHISLQQADAEELPFEDNRFAAVSVLFGVRNFENKARGLEEIYRVTAPNGRVYILEFGVPKHKIIGTLFRFYFHKILPAIGGLISKDFQAYDYLPRSVDTFPSKEEFCQMLIHSGYREVTVRSMTFGVANLYCGKKL